MNTKAYIIIIILVLIILVLLWFWKRKKKSDAGSDVALNHTQTQNLPDTKPGQAPGILKDAYSGSSAATDPEVITILNYNLNQCQLLSVDQALTALVRLGKYTKEEALRILKQSATNGCDITRQPAQNKMGTFGQATIFCTQYNLQLADAITQANNDPSILAALSNNPNYKPVLK